MDIMLFESGLASSIDEARRFIMAGLAIADDKRVDKAGDMVPCDAHIRLKDRLPYVSRGGLKLKHAIDSFHLNLKDALVLDVGSSTGGFTDVCLQEGACLVYAVDSGTAQLHNKLLHDDRVKSFENSNFKNLPLCSLIRSFYPPKLSKWSISIGTPKLSSMPSTAFDIGPGPHM